MPDFTQTTLTGNWGGLRTRLYNKGVDLTLIYFGDAASNLTGGTRRTAAYAAASDFIGDIDFGKLAGWRGGSLHVELVNFDGTLLDAKANLGSLFNTEQAFVAGHRTWLTNFYLEQSLSSGRVDLKYGRMDLETAFFPYACVLQNLTFCGGFPGLMVGGLVAWPASAMGATVTVRPARNWSFTLGNYAVQPNNLVPALALKLQNRGRRVGNATLGELDIDTHLPSASSNTALLGHIAIGAWHDSTPRPDLLLNAYGVPQVLAGGAPLIRASANGFYVDARQQVTAPATGDGITLFASYTRADPKVAFIDSVAQVGVIDAGPLASRTNDAIQFALGRNHVSGHAAKAERLANAASRSPVPVQGAEYVAELDYVAQLYRGVSLMPNIQYTYHPGGTAAHHNYTVLGAQLEVAF